MEGANFDVRKHLLEYDDVLNAQRKRIYDQRDRVFTKEDLREDVAEMLRTELQNAHPGSAQRRGRPLEAAGLPGGDPAAHRLGRPALSILHHVPADRRRWTRKPAQDASAAHLRRCLLDLAERALKAERDHLLKSVHELLDKSEESLAAPAHWSASRRWIPSWRG